VVLTFNVVHFGTFSLVWFGLVCSGCLEGEDGESSFSRPLVEAGKMDAGWWSAHRLITLFLLFLCFLMDQCTCINLEGWFQISSFFFLLSNFLSLMVTPTLH
jgi:hypothetical protein